MGFEKGEETHYIKLGHRIQRDLTKGKSDLEIFGLRAHRAPRQINAAYARAHTHLWPWGWQRMYMGVQGHGIGACRTAQGREGGGWVPLALEI